MEHEGRGHQEAAGALHALEPASPSGWAVLNR